MKSLIFIFLLLSISSCATFSGKKPVAGDDTGMWAITIYKPVPASSQWEAPGVAPVSFAAQDITKYLLISEQDYLEITALINSAVIWNRDTFAKFISSLKALPVPVAPAKE